jgi:RNA polymerase sigma-54 factor
MVSLQPKLSLKVSQKQILTPGLVQMVSVLALNKLELRDMITAEMVENPVLEELENSVPLLDDTARRDEERAEAPDAEVARGEKKDSFEEIDFGSFFREYLDPGFKSPETEAIERPSFENFLSRPSTLTDHLMWQLGAMSVKSDVAEAAELIIGNLNEEGYLTATDEELLTAAYPGVPSERTVRADVVGIDQAEKASGNASRNGDMQASALAGSETPQSEAQIAGSAAPALASGSAKDALATGIACVPAAERRPMLVTTPPVPPPLFDERALQQALELIRQMDPPGVAARTLRECLLAQLKFHLGLHERQKARTGENGTTDELLSDSYSIVDQHLRLVENKQYKEIAKSLGRPVEAVQQALDFIRTLDPKPGLRYNKIEARLIEPDVAFIKHGDTYLAVLNDDDVPQLRLSPTYRRLLNRDSAEKDVRNYVKEKYKSAVQLIKNIEQRKQTILKVCYAIIGRQQDFLDKGIDQLKPMMIKEVAEEIGVHPSTVSRAVANKYAHTPQGVFELRYFFSESVNGPEGGGTSLLILKRRVKKLIEEEDPARPLTDEQITRILQSQGIQVTRRTVAKYREDMRIPSTHQRRIKN